MITIREQDLLDWLIPLGELRIFMMDNGKRGWGMIWKLL